jgi:hypothetical protein
MRARRCKQKLFVGRPEGRRQLGRPRRRWEDTIKTNLKEIGWAGVDWTEMAQDRTNIGIF